MSDYGQLRQQAEQLLGRKTVDQIEKKIRGSSSSRYRELIDVAGADMRTHPPEEKSQELARPGELIRGETIPVAKHLEEQKSATERLLSQAIRGEYRYAMLGLILGLGAVLGGVILGLHGVVGHTSWTGKFLGIQSNLND